MSVFKEITFDEQLNEYRTNDQRLFVECVDFQLKMIRQKARDLILEDHPD